MGAEAMSRLAGLPVNPRCDDTSPSGAAVCNALPAHPGFHSFTRGGLLITRWPRKPEECTHGGDCKLHPETNAPHNLDDQPPAPAEPLAVELRDWWLELAEQEAQRVIPKTIEYGATDLIDLGRDLAECAKREVTDAQAAELGIYFYLRGKFARWRDAIIRGDQVSDDTLFDIAIYVRMAQRVRSHGGWPGTNKEARNDQS